MEQFMTGITDHANAFCTQIRHHAFGGPIHTHHLLCWKENANSDPATRDVRQTYGPAVEFEDLATHCQAQSGPLPVSWS